MTLGRARRDRTLSFSGEAHEASLWASAVASALAAFAPSWAQHVKPVEKITVTASPLGRGEAELAQPASVLSEEDLRRKRAASIGDTLAQETGVQSSSFGAGAGRPIIRGLDGPRVRVLENSIGTGDASSVSPDHAVTTESLRAEQIEILRGPASLLYGSGAIGGVVNVVSKTIPRERVEGAGGEVESRFGGADRERTGSVALIPSCTSRGSNSPRPRPTRTRAPPPTRTANPCRSS